MEEKATVFVVDDNQDILDSLSWLISSVNLEVKTYHDAISFLEKYSPEQKGCLVTDIRMPGMSGLELQEELNSRHLNIPVIFITGHGDIQMTVRAMKAGAVDFLTKPINNQVLLETIHKALLQDESTRNRAQERAKVLEKAERLTPREREVLERVVQGKLSKIIAEELEISCNTVEIHRANIMKKMQVKSLGELINQVLTYGVLEFLERRD